MIRENCTAAADVASYCGSGGLCDAATGACFCAVGTVFPTCDKDFWHPPACGDPANARLPADDVLMEHMPPKLRKKNALTS